MIEPSQFSISQPAFDAIEKMDQVGSTCDAYRVKLYGKLHFLKRLKPEFAGDIRYQEAFRKEFETGYRLEHPALVRYLSLSDDAILMEYVDGETLTQRLERQPDFFRSRRNTDRLLGQLLDAVAYLHAHQVLHLDLKPDNILLTRINNDVRLVDLGCCYTDTFVDTKGHTNGFAAPEQVNGGAIDARTDIYAIGRIMQWLPNVPIYKKVVKRCTEADPVRRYPSIDEVKKALKGMQRRRWVLLSVALLALVAAVLFLALPTRQKQLSVTPSESSDTSEAVTTASDTHSSADTLYRHQSSSFPEEVSSPALDSPSTPDALPSTLTPPSSPSSASAPTTSVAASSSATPTSSSLAEPTSPSSSLSSSTPVASPEMLQQLREDIRRRFLPIYNETLGVLPDTVRRGDRAWSDANRLFQSKVEEEFKALFINYCQLVPIPTISKEFNEYLNSLYK